jgi:hypothetical protein
MVVLLMVQIWLLAATLDAYLGGHRDIVVPGTILFGTLPAGCGALTLPNTGSETKKSARIGIGGMGEWLKPAVLKRDQAPSARFSKFNVTSVQPSVCSHSDLHS